MAQSELDRRKGWAEAAERDSQNCFRECVSACTNCCTTNVSPCPASRNDWRRKRGSTPPELKVCPTPQASVPVASIQTRRDALMPQIIAWCYFSLFQSCPVAVSSRVARQAHRP
jgi:hypothetical protein